jgi:hypothetical protein
MSETLLSIQEAAEISGKSIQTIRRALKGNKLQCKRRKTPQGFNYMIERESLVSYYKLAARNFDRAQGGIKGAPEKSTSKEVTGEFASMEDLKKMQKEIEDILEGYKKEKETFMRFMKTFQERFVVMENQMKLLEQPQRKWFEFWK